jgi:hypothetical protein
VSYHDVIGRVCIVPSSSSHSGPSTRETLRIARPAVVPGSYARTVTRPTKVERKALCVYSQVKTCSSSEVTAMVEEPGQLEERRSGGVVNDDPHDIGHRRDCAVN